MADEEESTNPNQQPQQQQQPIDSPDDDEYDSDEDSVDSVDDIDPDDDSPSANLRRFISSMSNRRNRRLEAEEEKRYVYHEDLYNFPPDPERWTEEDLREFWADAPLETEKPGWDPVAADEEDWEIVRDEMREGRDPPIAPFYIPYRKCFPAIPDNHHDIATPKGVIEELDRIEEFLKWVSFIFHDGSSYEGTVWDDLAHGKGVYVAEEGLVRYEGEWLQNQMEGHGVVEVEIPDTEPRPGSKLEDKMRAQGKIISRDYMSPRDREWLEMDIEDSYALAGGKREVPFYENNEWIRIFGRKPEKGRYRYSGQWKHGHMHGCGVYEVNERIIYGRFYFGNHVNDDSAGCDADASALHAGIAEVAAAKARMFINKPDGMIREARGPYGDPQHPYLYEEEEAWQAPGFINQFYDVPDYWKTYVEEVDQEREMWLNSFYKAPLRLPMPAELEYWWSKDEVPEFVLINQEPEPDPEDPSKLIQTEEPLILHTRTGRLINYTEDEEHGIRLFWQPNLKEGDEVDPDEVEFLPLGFDEFYGKVKIEKKSKLLDMVAAMENAFKPWFERLERWTEEQKKASKMKLDLINQELEFIEAQICLEEAMEDLEMELKRKQKEEEKRDLTGEEGEEPSAFVGQEGTKEEEEADEEEEDEEVPVSFGSVSDQGVARDDKKANNSGNSPFSSLSLSLATSALASMMPLKKLQRQPSSAKHLLATRQETSESLTNENVCSLGLLASYFAYLALTLSVLPGKVIPGVILSDGSRLHYRCNGLLSLLLFIGLLGIGIFTKLISPVVLADRGMELLSTTFAVGVVITLLLYASGRSSKEQGSSLTPHVTGNFIHDLWFGIQLNPQFMGVDLKFFFIRAGMMGWLLINLSVLAKSLEAGNANLSMILYQIFCALYVIDYFFYEEYMTSTWDIIAERLGFMLVFGDLVWIPFTFSIQGWWLLRNEVELSTAAAIANCIVFLVGYMVFRGANKQKHVFKKNPKALIWGRPPKVIGGRLLASGYCSIIPYFYPIYLLILLIWRERRDEEKCAQKYKDVWAEYCKLVPSRILPYIY
ncbi:Delta(14)-sterol reductase [Acorus gramineus]|uniref:Delta(14)-sterol reductase n=1 Tax=Acorus gramineus TaxID=55184 RepID=A0AAV9BLE4_ACOGR|nr:Delta(14)-sterol reductase [Acorus gramineus]